MDGQSSTNSILVGSLKFELDPRVRLAESGAEREFSAEMQISAQGMAATCELGFPANLS